MKYIKWLQPIYYVLMFVYDYMDITYFYTKTQHTSGTDHFTCWGVEDGSLVSKTCVDTKFWLGAFSRLTC